VSSLPKGGAWMKTIGHLCQLCARYGRAPPVVRSTSPDASGLARGYSYPGRSRRRGLRASRCEAGASSSRSVAFCSSVTERASAAPTRRACSWTSGLSVMPPTLPAETPVSGDRVSGPPNRICGRASREPETYRRRADIAAGAPDASEDAEAPSPWRRRGFAVGRATPLAPSRQRGLAPSGRARGRMTGRTASGRACSARSGPCRGPRQPTAGP